MRLRIPSVVAFAVVGSIGGAMMVACGDDSEEAHVHCLSIDAGPPPAPDANACGQTVVEFDDCPPGCMPVA